MNQYIARLLGHSFGDGHIHRAKAYFVYTNSCRELLDEVDESVNKEFGAVSSCRRTSIGGTPQIQFSAIVGRKLQALGAPQGSKTRQETMIPSTITKGRDATIANFLGALCDDEANVRTDSGSKQIALKSAKIASLEAELEAYLN
jgi:LAGLIDADG-like domain